VPIVGYTTGDIDIHDIEAGADGRPIFVTTLGGRFGGYGLYLLFGQSEPPRSCLRSNGGDEG
jgi:hypothetical protein